MKSKRWDEAVLDDHRSHLDGLRARFEEVAETPDGEWTIRIANLKQAKDASRLLSAGNARTSKAHTTFDEAIRDAELLLQHCEGLGDPLPQDAEVFKRAGLVMAMTAWETYIEDRVREGLRSK